MSIDDNGAGMYTGLGHGDALHVGDFVPSRAGLQTFSIHEPGSVPGADLRDARTGARILAINNPTGEEVSGNGTTASTPQILKGSPT